jgi:1-acyl-sn-glycerol-3-phosphate acyltransferase
MKVLLTPLFHLLWRVRVEGREHVPARGGAVLAANHQSFCDSLFLPLVVRRKVTFLAKAEYFDTPKTAWFFRAVGQIPIRRGGGSQSDRALETATGALAGGALLAIYPEGTRARDAYVHKGRTGVARLSRECGVAVVPVGIHGTVDVQPIGKLLMRPWHTVTIRFGAPMRMEAARDPADPMADHDHARCRAFTDDLMKEISRLSARPYVDEYVTPSVGPSGGRAAPARAGEGRPGPTPTTAA